MHERAFACYITHGNLPGPSGTKDTYSEPARIISVRASIGGLWPTHGVMATFRVREKAKKAVKAEKGNIGATDLAELTLKVLGVY